MAVNIDTMIEIFLPEYDDFLKVQETLTRIGVASKKDKTLYQSCHILHKQGRYFIVHFKELFALDGKKSDFEENDVARRNTIANLLDEWGLVELEDPERTAHPTVAVQQLKILPYKEKGEWNLEPKYNIGRKKS
jgi:hypothetical protein